MRGPRNRGGYTPFSNMELEAFFNDLRPEQAVLYVGLRAEAQFGESVERTDKFGRTFRLDVGEVLYGHDTCAARYGVTVDFARRAVRRFVQLGLVSMRPAVAFGISNLERVVQDQVWDPLWAATPPATPYGPEPATPTRRDAATPPTILTFLTDREKCWSGERPATPRRASPATPPATPHASQAATIQPVTKTHEPPQEEKKEAAPKAAAATGGSPRDGGRDLSFFSKPVADCIRAIEACIGKMLVIPKDGDERARIDLDLGQTLRACGHDDVVRACVKFIEHQMADDRYDGETGHFISPKKIYSVSYLVKAMDRVLNGVEWDDETGRLLE